MSLSPTLKRHSPSQLNQYIEYRSQWFISRIRGIYVKAGLAACRGTAVEAGINYYIENEDATQEKAIAHALKAYTQESVGIPEDFNMRQSIAPCVIAGLKSFEDKGYFIDPPELQAEINCRLPGCKVDLFGKLDYKFDNIIIDNKVTSKTPSCLSQGYILQGACYRYATGLPVKFHFIIPLKSEVKIKELTLSDEEYEYGLALATKTANHIELIYNALDDLPGDLLEALFFTNPDSLWDVREKAVHSEQFGIDIPTKKMSSD